MIEYYACGIVSKAEVRNIPLIGKVAEQIKCLFVKRENEQNRHVVVIFKSILTSF